MGRTRCRRLVTFFVKFHHIWTPTAMAPVNVITPWCDKIAAESNNRMKCQLLPAMSGGGTKALRA
jgi:TRAP-type transport system periplasmic protein